MGRAGEAVRGSLRAAWRLIGSALAAVPTLLWIAIGLVAALIVAVTASGGLRAVETVPVATAMGDELHLSEYTVTVLDAAFTDAVEDQFLEADAGETLLVVTMELENTTDRPIGLTTSADRISTGFVNTRNPLFTLTSPEHGEGERPGIEPTTSVLAWRTDGSAGSVILQPGVPSALRVAWTVPADAVAAGVSLDVYDAQVTTGQILISSDQVIWRRGELAARIELDGDR
ncbi:hypothetical protein [Microbacterium sp.]|uniref:hypothetical protein n=1 Tax=Microbacterium sp. TaxID=51671 RepID=UPI00263846CB|nr:hypothetical protein [Microbacterium sp.]